MYMTITLDQHVLFSIAISKSYGESHIDLTEFIAIFVFASSAVVLILKVFIHENKLHLCQIIL